MAVTNTVQTASATNTQIDDSVLNPTVTNTTGRQVVHVTLVFDGVDFIPDDVFDALNAEYGTVATDKNVNARGCYIFTISA